MSNFINMDFENSFQTVEVTTEPVTEPITEPVTEPITVPETEPVMESETAAPAPANDYTDSLNYIHTDLNHFREEFSSWVDEWRLDKQPESETLNEQTELQSESQSETNSLAHMESMLENLHYSVTDIRINLDKWKVSGYTTQFDTISSLLKESNVRLTELTNINIGILVGIGFVIGVGCAFILSIFFKH